MLLLLRVQFTSIQYRQVRESSIEHGNHLMTMRNISTKIIMKDLPDRSSLLTETATAQEMGWIVNGKEGQRPLAADTCRHMERPPGM